MKKLLGFMSVVMVAFLFAACSEDEPKFNSTLNTKAASVGKLYGRDGMVNNCDDAMGIVFAESSDGKYVYLVAFTDVLGTADERYDDSGNPLPGKHLRVFSQPGGWSTVMCNTWANDVDGAVNTDKIIAVLSDTLYHPFPEKFPDSVLKHAKDTLSAAQLCREYYKKSIITKDLVKESDYKKDTKWADTKGMWYLPSMQELAALMEVREDINKKYGSGPADSPKNANCFIPIGCDLDCALWSSTEYNRRCAWYDLPASNNDNYMIKSAGNDGNGRIYVRPICKVRK